MEYHLVDRWLKKDPTRWVAGAIGGLFAGAVMAAAAMVIASKAGMEPAFPLKLVASVFLGPQATDYASGSQAVLLGLVAHEVLAMFLGILFGQFVVAETLAGFAAMGLVWGVFSWIFLWNLYFQSFRTILASHVSSAVVFPVCILFGLSLTSVGVLYRQMRG